MELPYSVKQGETVAIEMIVYNYLEKEISAEVTLENPGGKSFAFGSKNPNEIEQGRNSMHFRKFHGQTKYKFAYLKRKHVQAPHILIKVRELLQGSF